MKKVLNLFLIICLTLLILSCKNRSNIENSKHNAYNAYVDPAAKNSKYSGVIYKGNYIWFAGMNLAWNELSKDLIHGKIGLATQDSAALATLNKLNYPVITKKDVDAKSLFYKCGFGQKTVEAINRERKIAFPDMPYPDLEANISGNELVAYAYFMKKVEFLYPFTAKPLSFMEPTVIKNAKEQIEVVKKMIQNKQVDKSYHFKANIPWLRTLDPVTEYHFVNSVHGLQVMGNAKAMQNIDIIDYQDEDHFMVRIQLKDPRDQLFIAKGFPLDKPDHVIAFLRKKAPPTKNVSHWFGKRMQPNDTFEMPKLNVDLKREYSDMLGKTLSNKIDNNDVSIGMMGERVRFVLQMSGINSSRNIFVEGIDWDQNQEKKRDMQFNKPFWIIMKRYDSNNPYFILRVTYSSIMHVLKFSDFG